MSKYRKLTHVVFKCDYHIVWVPKYRFRILTGAIKETVEQDIKVLNEWKNVEVMELSVQSDHVHIYVSVPPKLSVSEYMGFLKGKLAIKIFKSYSGLRQKPYWGNHFWARGYFVNTVGANEEIIKRYIQHQEKEERKTKQQNKGYDLFQSHR